jgi:hypothetical protein
MPKVSHRSTADKTPRKKTTSIYRVRNGAAYGQALKQRGNVTLWFSTDAVQAWGYQGPAQRGVQFVYSDVAIETALTLRLVYHLALRQTEGFVESVLALMGLKVYGEGEWKVRQHGWSVRRTWRKLHLGVNEATGEVVAETLTENSGDDASQVEPLLEQIEDGIETLGGDGGYDKHKVFEALADPPQEQPIQALIASVVACIPAPRPVESAQGIKVGGSRPRISPAAQQALEAAMKQGQIATLEQMRCFLLDQFGLSFRGVSGLSRWCKRHRIKLKTGRPRHAKASDEAQGAFKK